MQLYLLTIAMFVLSVNYCETDSGIIHDLDLDLYNRPRENVNMPNKRPYATVYLLAIAITICEKFAIEMFMTSTLTIRMCQCQI